MQITTVGLNIAKSTFPIGPWTDHIRPQANSDNGQNAFVVEVGPSDIGNFVWL